MPSLDNALPGHTAARPLAQSGVLQASRVQLIRGLVRTMTKADLSTGGPPQPATGFIPGGSAIPVENSYHLRVIGSL
jgi:hypothetical protein